MNKKGVLTGTPFSFTFSGGNGKIKGTMQEEAVICQR